MSLSNILSNVPVFPMGYGSLLRDKIHFKPDGDERGSGGAGGNDNHDDGEDDDGHDDGQRKKGDRQRDMISRDEAQKAFRERDRHKHALKSLAKKLGVDPDDMRIVETGNKDDPYHVDFEGLDETFNLLDGARKKSDDDRRKNGKWDDRERELTADHDKRTKKLKDGYERRIQGLEAYVGELAVAGPLRTALAAEGAIDDDGDGSFSDLVTLLSPRLKREIKHDEETGRVKVSVEPVDSDGEVLRDKNDSPVSIRSFVREFLDKRPKFRSAKFRSGPGAGGHGGQGGSGKGGDKRNHPADAADEMFGLSRR